MNNAEDAFQPTQEHAHFYASSVMNAVLAQLQQGLINAQPIVCITGEQGVGKSFVVREACGRWGARVHPQWLDLRSSAPDALLPRIIRAFGGHAQESSPRPERVGELARALATFKQRGSVPMIIIDDAHLLSSEALLELARIESAVHSARGELRVILIAETRLEQRLADPAFATLNTRTGLRCRVTPMPPADVRNHLQHRMAAAGLDVERVFSRKAARELHTVTRGVPAHVDELAAEAIRVARSAGSMQVSPEQVRAAAAQLGRPSAPESSDPNSPLGAPTPSHAPAARTAEPVAHRDATPAPAAPRTPDRFKPAPRLSRPEPTSPDAPSLDSANPRVQEWVSRFTDGQGSIRFGARMQLPPLTEPDALPMFAPKRPSSPIATRKVVTVLRAAPRPEPRLEPAPPMPLPVTPEPVAQTPEPPALRTSEPVVAMAPVESEAPITFVPQADAEEARATPAVEPITKSKSRSKSAAMPRPTRTPEPVAAEPVAAEPVAAEPVALEPAALEPAALEPAAVEPVAFEPLAETPIVDEPEPSLDVAPISRVPVDASVVIEAPVIDPSVLEPAPLVLSEPPADVHVQVEPTPEPAAEAAPAEPVLTSRHVTPTAIGRAPSAPREPANDDRTAASTDTSDDAFDESTASSANVSSDTPAGGGRKGKRKKQRQREREARRVQQLGSASQSAPVRADSTPTPAPRPTQAPLAARTPQPAPRVAPHVAPRVAPHVAPRVAPQHAEAIAQHANTAHESSNGPASPRHSRFVQMFVPAALMVGVAALAIFAGMRARLPQDAMHQNEQVSTAPVLPLPMPVDSVATTSAVPTKPTVLAEAEGPPPKYCLAVGTYLFKDRAQLKAKQLARRTGMKAWVASVDADGARAWRIRIGGFATEAQAERAADRLLSRGLVTEALVDNFPADHLPR